MDWEPLQSLRLKALPLFFAEHNLTIAADIQWLEHSRNISTELSVISFLAELVQFLEKISYLFPNSLNSYSLRFFMNYYTEKGVRPHFGTASAVAIIVVSSL